MRRMLQMGLMVLGWLSVETTALIETQKDVSLEWKNDFLLQITSTKCQRYSLHIKSEYTEVDAINLPYERMMAMDGIPVNLTLRECDGSPSPPLSFFLSYPELVKDLECFRNATQNTVCRWTPIAPAQDVRFFYFFVNENQEENESALKNLSSNLKECSTYFQEDGGRAGCNLELQSTHIYISFRGSDNRTHGNTFRVSLYSLRPPPLTWNVTKTEKKFLIHWEYPNFGRNWRIRINYTACNELRFKDITEGASSDFVDRTSYCRYCLAIKAESSNGKSYTQWTNYECFEADTSAFTLICVVAVLVLLVSASLVTAVFVCFRRNKDRIFPKIPEPRNLLNGISDDNFKWVLDSFYPASKEELSRITLVTKPQYCNTKPLKHPAL